MTDNGKLTLTIREAADQLGISRNLAYRLAKEGELPVIKLGKRLLVSKSRLMNLLQGETKGVSDAHG